ncbi:salicylate hydroxylase [Trametes meyenii]|nr:salicylate hydroxylase [Trametes meyenii]
MSTAKFRVAVIGGGVGGLTAAVALSRYKDIEIDVYDAANEFEEIGAGIGVWPRVWKVLAELGLADDLSKFAVVPSDDEPRVLFHLRRGDQRKGVDIETMCSPSEWGMIAYHRPDFHRVLLRHLSTSPRVRMFTRKRLASYEHSSLSRPCVHLRFQDGHTATCDLLIGADGVKSATRRRAMTGLADAARARGDIASAEKLADLALPKWSGTLAYRTTIPMEKVLSILPNHRVTQTPVIYLGKDTEVTIYSIARGSKINFACLRTNYAREYTTFDEDTWVKDVHGSELLGDLGEWEPEVHELFKCIEKPSRWAIHVVRPLPSYVFGRVALLGDAAHAMMPYQGAGAGQAIEDAYILAELLGDPRTTHATLERALKAYDAIRRPFTQSIQERSRANGLFITLSHPGFEFNACQNQSDQVRLKETARLMKENWEWAWKTTIDADRERALSMLDCAAS